jgi:hypothetical protein
MKPSKISYSESKESFDITTGLKSWRKAGVEIELDDVDSVEKGFENAKEIVANALGYKININDYEFSGLPMPSSPILYPNNGVCSSKSNFSTTTLPTIDYSAKEKVEKAIEDATSRDELISLQNKAIEHDLVRQYLDKNKTFNI